MRSKIAILIYTLLAIFFCLSRLSDIYLLSGWPAAIFPLDSLYMANLLFPSQRVPLDLASTIITPSNSIFIATPALYILAKALGSLRNIYGFLVLAQMGVPFLVFRLLRISLSWK